MAIIKELGANTLRLAHYQHAQYFYDLCDENGLIVWAENPLYHDAHARWAGKHPLQMTEWSCRITTTPALRCGGSPTRLRPPPPSTKSCWKTTAPSMTCAINSTPPAPPRWPMSLCWTSTARSSKFPMSTATISTSAGIWANWNRTMRSLTNTTPNSPTAASAFRSMAPTPTRRIRARRRRRATTPRATSASTTSTCSR